MSNEYFFLSQSFSAQANEKLQAQLDSMQKQLDSQKKSSQASSSRSRRPTSVAKGTAKKPQPKGKHGFWSDEASGSGEDDDDGSDDDQLESDQESNESEPGEPSQAAMEGRLRRLCEKKPSGKLRVPEEVHLMWSKGGHTRKELLKKLQDAGWDEDPLTVFQLHIFAQIRIPKLYDCFSQALFSSPVFHCFSQDAFVSSVMRSRETISRKKSNRKRGWHTVESMKTKLGWSKLLG